MVAGEWLTGLVLVALPAGVMYCLQAAFTISSGDTWAVVPTAASLVREGNLDIREYVPIAPPEYTTADPFFDGLPYGVMPTWVGVCSRYPVGMTVFALPVVTLGLACGGDFDNPVVVAGVERWAATLVAVAVLAAFFRVALLVGPPSAAAWATVFLAVGSAVYTTLSQALWQHGGVMLGLLALIATELHPRLRASAWGRVLFGAAVGLVFACRLNGVPAAVAVGLWSLLAHRPRGLWNLAAAIIGVAPWLAFYLVVYGSPLGPSASQAAGANWTTDVGGPLLGLLFSPARGLFVYQPWVVLAMVGLLLPPRVGWKWACAGQATAQLLVVSAWGYWWGGSCWGSRLLCEMLVPLGLLSVPVVAWLVGRRWGWWVLAGLAVVAAVPQVLGVWAFTTSANWKAMDGSTMWNPPAWTWPAFR
ncbi:MAG: hypothetical protein MUF18_18640 [Fimbriiglobus sp.]|nr:hypothetical protein [Fimbriiglobus sp.]